MDISVTRFKATCLGVVEKVRKEKSRITITRHGMPAAELIPISASSPGQLFGRSKDTTMISGDLLSTEEPWDAEEASGAHHSAVPLQDCQPLFGPPLSDKQRHNRAIILPG